MSDALSAGLDAYARGDYRAAAEAWVRALQTAPADKALRQYVAFLRGVAGAIVAEVEREVGATVSAATSVATSAATPVAASVSSSSAGSGSGSGSASASRSSSAPASASSVVQPPAAKAPSAALPSPEPTGADPWGAAPTEVVASEAAGIALIADRRSAGRDLAQISAKMREAGELDDFSQALTLAEELLALRPGDHDAVRVRDRARAALTQMSVNALGSLESAPRVKVASDQIIWLDLDQRAGFVLAQVDGISTYNDIISVTAMDELETLGILARLARDGIIGV